MTPQKPADDQQADKVMTSASTRRDMNTTNQKSDIKEEVKEFQGHTSSTLEEFIGNQQAQKQNGNPMDDPVE